METARIAATVVTRNRLALLKKCVDSLRNQSVNSATIVIINNGSTDGTGEWLAAQSDLKVIEQGNLGSAGGQNTAMAFAVENGFEAVYTMDDDCFPEATALERILAAWRDRPAKDDWVMNSLVADPDFDGAMSFGLWDGLELGKRTARVFYESLDSVPPSRLAGNLYVGWGCFFNGTLVPTALLRRIGLPRNEFFIRGDEVEFFYRVMRSANVATVTDSIVWHPGTRSIDGDLPDWKRYYSIRNEVVIHREYFPTIKTTQAYLKLKALKLRLLAALNINRRANRVNALAVDDGRLGNFSRDAFNL